MLVTVNPNRTLWEAFLPEECLGMAAELVAVDRLLDDAVFFEPYRPYFSPLFGRPSVPLETYLRLMFLKSRHGLSFEAVVREAADSLSWRRFCRVPLGERMPHPTTLMKTTKRCGEDVVAALNDALLAKAVEARVVKTDKIRADTTVVEANVAYPTDSGLLARGVTKMASMVKALHGMGLATRPKARDRTRAMRRRAHAIGVWLRRRSDDAQDEVRAINAEMADLEATAALVERVVAQTRQRMSGQTPEGATRVVSLHDPDARPICKGRIGKPIEFGYQAQVVDNADGIVLDYAVFMGNPADTGLLLPAVARIKARLGRAPRALTADRGYADTKVDTGLADLGVATVVIPRNGRPGAARRTTERSPRFRRLVKWRTGCEGRISHLKHGYGWNRTLIDGLGGATTWCGLSVLAHNAMKISGLIEAKNQKDVSMKTFPQRRATDPTATGPPGRDPSLPTP